VLCASWHVDPALMSAWNVLTRGEWDWVGTCVHLLLCRQQRRQRQQRRFCNRQLALKTLMNQRRCQQSYHSKMLHAIDCVLSKEITDLHVVMLLLCQGSSVGRCTRLM
jgi:hypothetical protein